MLHRPPTLILTLIFFKVSVKEGLDPNSRRRCRLETGSTVEASHRVANHTTEDRLRYSLGGQETSNSNKDCKEGESWVSASHSTMYPPQALIDVVAVTTTRGPLLLTPSTTSTPSINDDSKTHEVIDENKMDDTISLRMAGAVALTFFEKSVTEFLSCISSLIHSQPASYTDSSNHGSRAMKVVNNGGVLLRPLGTTFSFTILSLVAQIAIRNCVIVKTDNGDAIKSKIESDSTSEIQSTIRKGPLLPWGIQNILDFTRAIGLCAVTTIHFDGRCHMVRELAVIHLLNCRLQIEDGVLEKKGGGRETHESGNESYESKSNLLENLLLGTKHLFIACLPPKRISNPCPSHSDQASVLPQILEGASISPDLIKEEKGEGREKEEELECRCTALRHIVSTVCLEKPEVKIGVLGFWIRLLEYVASRHVST
jgi:hypothetical protein